MHLEMSKANTQTKLKDKMSLPTSHSRDLVSLISRGTQANNGLGALHTQANILHKAWEMSGDTIAISDSPTKKAYSVSAESRN